MKFQFLLLFLVGCNLNKTVSTKAQNLWKEIDGSKEITQEKVQHPSQAKYYSLSEDWLAGLQQAGRSEEESVRVELPDPDGELRHFKIWDSGIIAPALAAKYPNMRTYKGYEVDHPKNRIRLESPSGKITAQIMSEPVWLISPYNLETYQIYFLKDLPEEEREFFEEIIK